jgi:hypothetical protein
MRSGEWECSIDGLNHPAQITAKLSKASSFDVVFKIIKAFETQGFLNFNARCYSAAVYSLGKHLGNERGKPRFVEPAGLPQVFASLVSKAELSTDGFQARDLSNYIYAIVQGSLHQGSTQTDGAQFLSSLMDRARVTPMATFDPQSLSNLCYALAKAGIRDVDLFAKVMNECVQRNFNGFDPQAISNLCWALATLDMREESKDFTFCLICLLERRGVKDFLPIHLGQLSWSYGKLKCELAQQMFQKIAEECTEQKLDAFSTQHLGNVAFGFGALKIFADVFYQQVERQMRKRTLKAFEPAHLCQILIAASNSETHHKGIFALVAEELIKTGFAHYSIQQVTNIARTYANAEQYNADLMELIRDECSMRRDLREFGLSDLAQLYNSWAKLGIRDEAFIARLNTEVISRDLATLDPQLLVNIIHAHAQLGITDLNLLHTFLREIQHRRLAHFNLQDICNLLWSLACLDVLQDPVVESFMSINDFEFPDDVRDSRLAGQLNDCVLAYRVLYGDKAAPPPLLNRLVEHDNNWILTYLKPMREFQSVPTHSQTHLDVAAALRFMGFRVENEFEIDYYYRLRADMRVISPAPDSQSYLVEYEGPHHYCQDRINPRGSALLKRRLLTVHGIPVVHIPFMRWDAVQHSSTERTAYLQSLFTNHPWNNPDYVSPASPSSHAMDSAVTQQDKLSSM